MVTAQLIGFHQKILIFLPKVSELKSAAPGDIVTFRGKPELVRNDGNPFEFDYQNYLGNKNIGYRIFLKERDANLLKGITFQNIFHKALIFRARLLERLGSSGIDRNNVHLIGSIAFGSREDVDKDVIQSFTNTGVIHVLAVSGMNVGLIFVILNLIFSSLKTGNLGNFIYTVIILAGIWAYTLITGMSPSILRAALMFSFLIFGRFFGRDSNIFNSLAVSAFILIAWNPNLITDVGFQLSYMAVLSIVVIHPLLVRQLYFDNWLLRQIWSLISVTCAAQIGTIPFTLIYFHQFPVYFWLANLLVIPLVSVILYLAFLVVFLSLLSTHIATLVAIFLNWSVKIVLLTVKIVGDLPHAVIQGLYPTFFQISLFIMMISLFLVFLRLKKAKYFFGALITLCLFCGTMAWFSFRQLSRSEVVFFNIPGTRALVLTSRKECFVLYDKCEKAESKLVYYMKSYFGERGVKKVQILQLSDSLHVNNHFLLVDGYSIFFRGVRIYIEPQTDFGLRSIDYNQRFDVVWIPNQRVGRVEMRPKYQSRIVLYRPEVNANSGVAHASDEKWIEVNRAVQITFRPSETDVEKKTNCAYFN